ENKHALHILTGIHEAQLDVQDFLLAESLGKHWKPCMELLDNKSLIPDENRRGIMDQAFERHEVRMEVTVECRLDLRNPNALFLGLLLLTRIDDELQDLPSNFESRAEMPRLLGIGSSL